MTRLMYVPFLLFVMTTMPLLYGVTPSEEQEIISRRAAEIVSSLPDQPELGLTFDHRNAWERYGKTSNGQSILQEANDLIKVPCPEIPESLYKLFYKTGNRDDYQTAYANKVHRFEILVLAEGIENKGRFIPEIEVMIRSFCKDPSWVLPAHDRDAIIYDGKAVYSDLTSTAYGALFALSLNWMGNRISPELRKLLSAEIERRVLVPYENDIKGISSNEEKLWWIRGDNNWNSVCTNGTVVAAIALCSSKERRAWFIAAAEYFTRNYFFKGFTPDGYCSEGVDYWDYGFGNFVSMAAAIRQATGNTVDFLQMPMVKKCTEYGPNMEIACGFYAAFADCSLTVNPSPYIVGYISRQLKLGYTRQEQLAFPFEHRYLAMLAVYYFSPEGQKELDSGKREAIKPVKKELPIRTEFSDAGVLICRPSPGFSDPAFAIALKGGHNNELHNHNDVGSYSLLRIVPGKVNTADLPVLDAGGETYTRRTFSSQRYEGELLNSFGHPVPRVEGTLQKQGKEAKAVVLEKAFSDSLDRISFDLSSAYSLKQSAKIVRTFEYIRHETEETGKRLVAEKAALHLDKVPNGSVTITDSFEFRDQPGDFETALVTFQNIQWKKLSSGQYLLTWENKNNTRAVIFACDKNGKDIPLALEKTIIGEKDDSVKRKPTRIGIRIISPIREGAIRVSFVP